MAGRYTISPDELVYFKSRSSGALQEVVEAPMRKKLKLSEVANGGGEQHKRSHIMVERNRRKQMTEHLSVLRSLTPCFYNKRGDQASIIGGVVDYITELQRVLQTLEAKKRRKAYGELLTSHRTISSPQKPQLSPRPSVPISPRTPQPTSQYRPVFAPFVEPSLDTCSNNELLANSRSSIAEVEVKFSGGNLLLKTCSSRIPGQTTRLIAVLENLSLEVLHVDISVIDETMVNSFTIKIGVDCQLSAEELAQHIQHTFC
ncbi:transcription factor SPEECHLESS-like [Bidens hawaiensis]|uniref:transcription factor SPEECHLESS-like n=1 Tax=Bidens hawaiensis TaxID=980011 RepID=UPI00404B0B27